MFILMLSIRSFKLKQSKYLKLNLTHLVLFSFSYHKLYRLTYLYWDMLVQAYIKEREEFTMDSFYQRLTSSDYCNIELLLSSSGVQYFYRNNLQKLFLKVYFPFIILKILHTFSILHITQGHPFLLFKVWLLSLDNRMLLALDSCI